LPSRGRESKAAEEGGSAYVTKDLIPLFFAAHTEKSMQGMYSKLCTLSLSLKIEHVVDFLSFAAGIGAWMIDL
jgi:hypothetical protein